MELLAYIEASDETSATQRAIEMFTLTEEQRNRLASTPGDKITSP
jgi:hypothetical protein